MRPFPPSPYLRTTYARPASPLLLARRVPTADGAELATFVYAPEGMTLAEALAGAPVLALHGNGGSHGTFCQVIDRLTSAGLAVVALDSRSQGQSSRGSARPLTYELFAEDAICSLDALGVRAVHVVGHSDGGIEALLLARDHADRVLSIVAGGANITPEGVVEDPSWGTEESLRDNRAWAGWVVSDDVPAEVDTSLLPSADTSTRVAELLQLMYVEPNIAAESLGGISCPTCVLVGENDCITKEETRTIAAAIPGARLVVVPNVGHSLPRDAPDSVACQVLVNVLLAQRGACEAARPDLTERG